MSRAAANQEQGTKNQEQPRSGFNFQKPPPFKRRVFLLSTLSLAPLRLGVIPYQTW
jgi:hypothetical protein